MSSRGVWTSPNDNIKITTVFKVVCPEGYNASVEVIYTSFNACDHISNFDETLTRTTENIKIA